jgi:hypothetical protein
MLQIKSLLYINVPGSGPFPASSEFRKTCRWANNPYNFGKNDFLGRKELWIYGLIIHPVNYQFSLS